MAVFNEQYVMSNLSPNNQRPFRDPLELPYAPYTDQSMLGNDYYTGEIDEDSEFYNPYFNKYSNIKNTISKYAKPVMGSIMSGIMGIPGLGYFMNKLPSDPYARNYKTLADGAYMSSTGMKDKFGYNLNSFKNNFLQPGSNSYRSYALQGLTSLNKNKANNYYQDTYGKSYDKVKSDIQNKKNPFGPKNPFEGTSDYQGSGNSNSQSASQAAADAAQEDDSAGAGGYEKGGRVRYFFGGIAARGMKR